MSTRDALTEREVGGLPLEREVASILTAREVAGLPAGVPLPGELRPHQGQLPNPGDTPSIPSAAASTPGAALAGARVPGAPSLPEADPTSLTFLISRLANELFAAPAVAVPTNDPSSAQVPGSPGIALAPNVSSPTPNLPEIYPDASLGNVPRPPVSAPPVPASAPGVSPTKLGGSPFDTPLDFGGIASVSDPFALAGLPGLRFSLLEIPSTGETLGATPQVDVSHGQTSLAPYGFDQFPTMDARSVPSSDARGRSTDPSQASRSESSHQASSRGLFDPYALKREFPILQETVHGRPLVWFDNAATTQKPRVVIERLSYFYEHENSNIHRAAHTLAARATEAYENARESVRRFVNAPSTREIVFVRGATEAINLVAQSWGRRNVQAGDEIVISWLEHHANIVPWQQLCLEKGARLRVAPVDDQGQILLDEYEKLLNPKTRLVAFTQVSNALGTITPASEMIAMAHRHGARVLLDGAQAVSHTPVDVQSLGCDFYVFSGHKVFAPTGIGVLFGKSDVLEAMPPWQGGGNMIQDVTFERTVYQPPPARFEAGTGNIADAVGLGAALDWLSQLGVDRVERYEHDLLTYATEALKTVPGLTLIGTAPAKAGVLSFVLAGQKTEEVGGILDRDGIAVRSGHHCAQPILRRYGLEATVRASLAPYNTHEDVDVLVGALRRLQSGHATPR